MKRTLYFISILFISLFSFAEEKSTSFFFHSYGIEDGLVQSTITAIFQDSDGFIWIGTQKGLHRFDGYQFEHFRHEPENPNSLQDDNIIEIKEDHNKNLWVLTNKALNRLNIYTREITRYRMPQTPFYHSILILKNGNLLLAGENVIYLYNEKKDEFTPTPWNENADIDTNIISMNEDSQGNIYFATRTSGIYRYTTAEKKSDLFIDKKINTPDLSEVTISETYIDSTDKLWILTTQHGLFLCEPGNNKLTRLSTETSGLSSNYIRCMLELNEKHMLIGSFSGLSLLNRETLEVETIPFNPEKAGALCHYSVHSLFKDSNENIWVGTWKGLSMHSDYNKRIYTVTPKSFTGLIGKGIEDKDGTLWFATEGGGLMWYDPSNNTQILYPILENPGNYAINIIKTILLHDNYIYCTTNSGEVYRFDKTKKKHELLYDFKMRDIYSLHIDKKGRLWIPTNTSKGVVIIDNNKMTEGVIVNDTIRHIHQVTTITETEKGEFIFGTLIHGLYVYNEENKTLLHINNERFMLPETIRIDRVTSVIQDKNNNYWVSTFGNGLFIFDDQFRLKRTFKETPELTENIYSLVYDNQSSIWGNTGKELFSINIHNYTCKMVQLPPDKRMEFSLFSGFLTTDKTLYFPGNKNILCYQPHLSDKNMHIPRIGITGISINNKKTEGGYKKELILKSNETNLAIHYTALNYVSPLENDYAYMMQGADSEWNQVGDRRVAYYSHLKPGSYIFKVKGSNNDGLWNPTATEIHITVKPPLYKAWWAILLYISLISFIIYKFVHHKIVEHELKNNIKFKQMEKEKTEELHKEKIALFTSFSHELRTPLTLIINPLEDLIRHKVFSKEIRQTLVLMKRNTERLMLLVNNLMDIQKYNSKRVVLRKETFDIIQFTGDVYKAFENLAKSKEITYEFKNYLPETLPVHYDPIELEKVFFNLLSNAFKYTPRGGEVRIEVHLYDKEEEIVHKRLKSEKRFLSNQILYFKVEDNGAGIPEKDLNKIFEPFCRLQTEGDESVIGSGIGLSVARSIVEQENGIIWAENKKTKGCSFHILLPIEKDLNPEVRSYTLKSYEHDLLKFAFPSEVNTGKSRVLLIVEDNQDVLKYLENNFSSQYYILTASTGIEALQTIEKTKPDLILSDNIMPEMDGIELCRNIKNNPATSHIPFILMSAESSLPKIKEGYLVGADDYILKPFEISLLKTRIENLIKSRKSIQKKYEKKIAVDNLDIPVDTNDELFLKQYTDIIRNNFSNPGLDVDFICQEIGMSRANFYRKAKRLTNLSPAEMIKKLRMEVAAQLLRDTDLSISEIITKVAFNGNGYFASTFRNIYGLTPKEYRKKFSPKQ